MSLFSHSAKVNCIQACVKQACDSFKMMKCTNCTVHVHQACLLLSQAMKCTSCTGADMSAEKVTKIISSKLGPTLPLPGWPICGPALSEVQSICGKHLKCGHCSLTVHLHALAATGADQCCTRKQREQQAEAARRKPKAVK
mmetsp:Transcript_65257/g.120150  ORF Transcript_65257/g.120150 Transcript_65257/m.120150 type:complete len:141 (+) Transcript_65257:61-483(+)